MGPDSLQILWPVCIFISMLAAIGFYCMLATFNLMRALIGLELFIKAVTLLIVAVGYVTRRQASTQAMVITFIVIEVVIMVVAIGVVLGIRGHRGSLVVRNWNK
jgi:multisubunit Na+/H+ antiporter MnhC subunit